MKKKINIALAGNPNSGKTTVFNAITGARQHIANYPGVTVEKKIGHTTFNDFDIEIVDLPGTYSLTAYSLEEIVARDYLVNERPDLVVDIVDASNLDRNLYLAVQLRELGIPLVLALNMMDVAESRGIAIDHQELSALMEVPVVPIVARSNKGIRDLLNTIVEIAKTNPEWKPVVISYGMDIDQGLDDIEAIINASTIFDKKYPSRWRALKCMEMDGQIYDLLKRDPALGKKISAICKKVYNHSKKTLEEEPEGIIADYRYGYITGITKRVLKRKIESRLNLSDKIDMILTNRIVGPILMILILYSIYGFTFWGSEIPIGWFESFFDYISKAFTSIIPPGHFQSLIVSGIIDGVGGVLGFVPLIMFMFFAIAIMEDSGYMARVAYMLDRILRLFGLHGNSVMALIISGGIAGGCAVPGAMATRTLRGPKERIATLLAIPFMNCGAKLPIYAVLIGAFFSRHQARVMFILTLLSWAFALLAAKIIRITILKGPNTPFVMELPPYRLPTLKGLIIHAWERTWEYVKKAGTVILGFSVILWAMMTFPTLSENQIKSFENKYDSINKSFIALPEIRPFFVNESKLIEFNRRYESYISEVKEKDIKTSAEIETDNYFPFLDTVYKLKTSKKQLNGYESVHFKAAQLYLNYRHDISKIDIQKHQAALKKTVAGRLGLWLENITRPLGFDYRINIALVGGFAAKEIVVSTLGTAYSLSETDTENTSSLSARIKNDKDWNPLRAFTLIIFTMLYVPCFVTVISIRKESSWKWAGFSIIFNLSVAYLTALIISKAGAFFGIGL